MKKNIWKIPAATLIFLLMLSVLVSCGETSGEPSGDGGSEWQPPAKVEYVLLEDGTYGVKAAEKEGLADVEIDAVYNGAAVTKVLDNGFSFCHQLESVHLPDSITYVGENAFSDCTSLRNINMTDNVTYIGERAFANCVEMRFTHIPQRITAISKEAFYNCRSLNGVVLPETLTAIGEGAFSSCQGLTSISLPDSITVLEKSVFSDCGLTSIVIKNVVTEIGDFAFAECRQATSLTIGSGVTSIGEHAFSYCESLTAIVIPGSVRTIGRYAFQGCENVATINVGTKDIEMGDYAFDACTGVKDVYGPAKTVGRIAMVCGGEDFTAHVMAPSFVILSETISGVGLTKVVIDDSVQGIADNAFFHCEDLLTVEIPTSVTRIGTAVFGGCPALTVIDYKGTKTEWENIDKNRAWDLYCAGDFVIQCTDGNILKDAHKYE